MGRELYEFGEFRLDPAGRKLWRRDEAVAITPKALDTLIVLVQNRETSLNREELIARIWPDTVVGEHNLNQCIAVLRKALDDNPRQPAYIATLPGRGYAFVAEVRVSTVGNGVQAAAQPAEQTTGEAIAGKPSWRARAVGASLILLLVLAAGVWTLARRLDSAAAARKAAKPRPSVAVLEFENLNQRADVGWLSTALPEMLTTELGAGGALRTFSGDEVARAVSEVKAAGSTSSAELASHLNRALGAEYVVTGGYTVLSSGGEEQVRLDLKIQKAANGDVLASASQEGSAGDLFLLVARTGTELRQDLGAGPASRNEEGQTRAALPSNLVAERNYVAGLASLGKFSVPEAKDLLEKAVAADPSFPLAHLALADAWRALGYQSNEQAEAKRAWELASRLSREDQLRIEAKYMKTISDWAKSLEDYRSLTAFFPDNLDYELDLVGTLTAAGKADDALATLAALRRHDDGNDPRLDFAEALAHGALSDYRRAAQAAERAASKGRQNGQRWLTAKALLYEAGALGSAGDKSQGDAVTEQARQLCQQLDDRSGLAVIYRWRGIANVGANPDEAERNFEAALKIARESGNLAEEENDLNGLAAVASDRGELHRADEMYEELLQSGRRRENKWAIQMALNNLGNDLRLEGRLVEAQRMEQEAVAVSRESGQKIGIADGLDVLGTILEMQGKLAEAQHAFDEAAAVYRSIGAENTAAPALAGQADIFRDHDQLGESLERHGAAFKYFSQAGDRFSASLERVALARLALDQGRPADAAILAEQAVEEFHKQKSAEQEGLSEAVLAEAMAAQGKKDQARAATERAVHGVARTEEILLRLQVQITAARTRALLIGDGHPGTSELQTLRAIAEEAEYHGMIALALEARAVEAGLLRGKPEAARFESRLEQEARGKGFLRIANLVHNSAGHS